MEYQYMIWQSPEGEQEHLVFNQRTYRIVYPPSHIFIYRPVQMAIAVYEGKRYDLIDQGAWRGDHIDEYLQAMRKMHPKELQTHTSYKARKPFKFLQKEDSPKDELPDT